MVRKSEEGGLLKAKHLKGMQDARTQWEREGDEGWRKAGEGRQQAADGRRPGKGLVSLERVDGKE